MHRVDTGAGGAYTECMTTTTTTTTYELGDRVTTPAGRLGIVVHTTATPPLAYVDHFDGDSIAYHPDHLRSATTVALLERMGQLQPGEPGLWKVWGARVADIRPGDVVLDDPAGDFFEVEALFEAKAAPLRVGIVVAGERQTLGAMCPVIVLRWGTGHTLADSVR